MFSHQPSTPISTGACNFPLPNFPANQPHPDELNSAGETLPQILEKVKKKHTTSNEQINIDQVKKQQSHKVNFLFQIICSTSPTTRPLEHTPAKTQK